MNPKENQKSQVLDQFTLQAEGYARLTAGLQKSGRRDGLASVPALPDDVALDVACGSGALTIPLAARVRHVTAIDLTPAMIDQGKARQAQEGVANIHWMIGDVDPLPFDDAAFSLVICSAAFHHLERADRVLREMARVCRPEGRVVVTDMTFPAAKAAAFDEMERLRDPSHVRVHTLEELRGLAAGTDLAEVQAETSITGPLSADAILATSFPTECTRDEIRQIILDDALSGHDRLGLSAQVERGELLISYPMATVAWRKRTAGSAAD